MIKSNCNRKSDNLT